MEGRSALLGQAVAMADVPPPDALPGTMLQVSVREVGIDAEAVALPFYRRRG